MPVQKRRLWRPTPPAVTRKIVPPARSTTRPPPPPASLQGQVSPTGDQRVKATDTLWRPSIPPPTLATSHFLLLPLPLLLPPAANANEPSRCPPLPPSVVIRVSQSTLRPAVWYWCPAKAQRTRKRSREPRRCDYRTSATLLSLSFPLSLPVILPSSRPLPLRHSSPRSFMHNIQILAHSFLWSGFTDI